ncbi:MAG: hypothetical protein K2Q10_02400, partial [Rhodospirillales bacterium]|nr:hypothetical protein [Rhodospirillales bacterium]
MAIVSRLSLSILALAGTLAVSGAVFAVENDPFDRYGVAPPTDPAKPANPAEAIMGIGNPHASQPNA